MANNGNWDGVMGELVQIGKKTFDKVNEKGFKNRVILVRSNQPWSRPDGSKGLSDKIKMKWGSIDLDGDFSKQGSVTMDSAVFTKDFISSLTEFVGRPSISSTTPAEEEIADALQSSPAKGENKQKASTKA